MKCATIMLSMLLSATLFAGLGFQPIQKELPKVPPSTSGDLKAALSTLRSSRFIDLTHSFEPGIPHWSGLPNEERTILYHHDKGVGKLGDGFLIHRYSIAGQWGTHVDPPAHFIKGRRTLDEIPPDEMVLPLVVLDVRESVAANPDYVLRMEDIEKFEKTNGNVPAGAFVAMRTGWALRWPDAKKMLNADQKGVNHYPGWSRVTIEFLVKQRKITAIGHETTDTDPGVATSKGDYSMEHLILGLDRYQIELLGDLEGVPPSGGIAVVSFPKPKGGSGFPARVFAIVPK